MFDAGLASTATVLNTRHFDEYILVTAPDNGFIRTQCANSQVTHLPLFNCPRNSATDPGASRAYALSAAIRHFWKRSGGRNDEHCLGTKWLTIVPPTIALPSNFRQRLLALGSAMDPHLVYRLDKVKQSASTFEFSALIDNEPWSVSSDIECNDERAIVVRFTHPVFENCQESIDDETQTNGRFDIFSFSSGNPHLPIVTLRGKSRRDGILSCEKVAPGSGQRPYELSSSSAEALSSTLKKIPCHAGIREAALIGIEAGVATTLASCVQTVYLADIRGISYIGENDLEEADRAFQWQKVIEELGSCKGVAMLNRPGEPKRRNWYGAMATEKTEMINLLVLWTEPSYRFLIEEFPRWRRLLKPGGILCGTHYGLPSFPQTTPAIELLLGPPDEVNENGVWSMRITAERLGLFEEVRTAGNVTDESGQRQCGVALFVFDHAEAKRAITALHALRRIWEGAVCVVKWGPEEPALRVFCALQRASYLLVNELAANDSDSSLKTATQSCVNRDVARLVAIDRSPFSKTLWLTPDAQIPRAAVWFERLDAETPMLLGERATAESLGEFACLRDADATRDVARRFRLALPRPDRMPAEALIEELLGPATARISGGNYAEMLCNEVDEAELLRRYPPRVRLPPGAVVITTATPEDIDLLRHNWDVIQWPVGTRRIVYLHGIDPETPPEFFPAGCEVRPLDPAIVQEFEDEPHWTWAMLTAALAEDTAALLYVDPYLTATPGAQLFCERRCAEAPYSSPGWMFLPLSRGARKIAKIGPPATLFNTAWLRTALERFRSEGSTERFEVFVHDFAAAEGRGVPVLDVLACGWNG